MASPRDVQRSAGWIRGGAGRPLFTVVHTPSSSQATSVALLVPSLGLDESVTHHGLRLLADRLAARGVCAIRVNLSSTGDSSGDSDALDRVPRWLDDVEAARAFARSVTAAPLVVLGLRMGANLLLAAGTQSRPDDRLVLWDPCPSGRSFLRAERATLSIQLGSLAPSERSDSSLEGPGTWYDEATIAALSTLKVDGATVTSWCTQPASSRPRVLLLTREGLPLRGVENVPGDVQVVEVTGQETFLDVPITDSRSPLTTLDLIANWAAAAGGDTEPVCLDGLEREVVLDGSAGPVYERVVELGPRDLFAIESRPTTAVHAASHEAALILTTTANVPHIGSARTWVTLARRLAARGCTVVRVDQYDVGDSPGVDEPPGAVYYSPAGVSDVIDAAAAVSAQRGAAVDLVGLSSGSWTAMMAANTPHVHGCYLMNQWVWTTDVAPVGPWLEMRPSRSPFRRAYRGLMYRYVAVRRTTSFLAQHRDRAKESYTSWRAARAAAAPSTAAVPLSLLESGTTVRLMFSEDEQHHFRGGATSHELARLATHPLFREAFLPDTDHAMFAASSRRTGLDVLERLILEDRGLLDPR